MSRSADLVLEISQLGSVRNGKLERVAHQSFTSPAVRSALHNCSISSDINTFREVNTHLYIQIINNYSDNNKLIFQC